MLLLLSRVRFMLLAACLFAAALLFTLDPHTAAAAPPEQTLRAARTLVAAAAVTPTLPFSRALDLRPSGAAYVVGEVADRYNLRTTGTTIDFWLYLPRGYYGSAELIRKPGAYAIGLTTEFGGQYVYFRDAEGKGITMQLVVDGWQHIALTAAMDGIDQVMCIFMAGNYYCVRIYNASLVTSSQPLRVGESAGFLIDELRYSSGLRYPFAQIITPPTGPFACDDDTIALWRFDEDPLTPVYPSACELDAELTPVYQSLLPLVTGE